ncbi:MAG TPA: ABC transporter permease, partial [Gemmatimonadaceae bacterium]|nr:ABC transporter permease [Gemmatimonadaceae bacterium]
LSLVLPCLGWLLLRAVYASHVPRELPVAVLDEDGTALSRRIARAIDAAATVRVIRPSASGGDAESILWRGDAYAAVVLPAGLERRVARGDATAVSLHTNGQWIIPSGLITRDVRGAVGTVSAEVELRERVRRGEPAARARVLVEPVRFELHPLHNPALDYAAFVLAALVPTLLQLFVVVTIVRAVGSELDEGTAVEWIDAGGGRVGVAVVGKLVPHVAWFGVLSIAMLEGTALTLTLPIAGSRALLWLALLLLVAACASLGVLLVAVTGRIELATSAAGFLTGPAFAVAGVAYPTEAMPLAGRLWSAALPLSHYLRVQSQQWAADLPLAGSVSALGVLLLVSLLPVFALGRIARLAPRRVAEAP